MNCTHIEKLIPLYIGGDLDSRMAHTLRHHIDTCGHCREIVAGFEESRDWMRDLGSPRFDEAIFDDLRETIHTQIRRPQARPSWLDLFAPLPYQRYAIAASVVVSLLIGALAIYGYRHRSPAPPVVKNNQTQDEVRQQPEKPKFEETAKTGSHSGTSKYRRPQRKPDPAATRVSRPVIIEWPATPEETAEIATGQPADATDTAVNREMLRIEFQTADPKIRIIWLVAKNSGISPIKSGGNDNHAPEEDGGPK